MDVMATFLIEQPAVPYGGWLRAIGGRWRQVVTGDGPDQTLDRLLDHTRQQRGNFDLLVLRVGQEPPTSRARGNRATRERTVP